MLTEKMTLSMRGLVTATLVSFHMASALVVLPQAPEPTSPPEIQDAAQIYARQEDHITETIVAIVAANNTCGNYYPVNTGRMTCGQERKCMYEVEKYGIVFCEDGPFDTDCIGNREALDTRSCDEDCRRNTNIRKCTSSGRPECFTVYYPSNVKGFFCASTSGYTSAVFFEEGTSTSTLQVPIYASEVTTESSTETSGSQTSNEATSTEATSTEATSTEATSTEPTSTSTNESQNEGSGGSKTNVGAIAGGVVGGVVGLAGLGLLAFFLRRRSKNKKQQTVSEMPAQNSPQPYGADAGPAWKQSPSPLQHSSPQVPVEAPNSRTAQVHEMDGNGNRQ